MSPHTLRDGRVSGSMARARSRARMRAALLAAVSVALAAIAVAAAALAAGCNPSSFSDLADETWVDSTESPDDHNSDDYGSAVAFGGSSGAGAAIAVATRAPAGVVLLEYDESGGLDSRAMILSDQVAGVLSLPDRPVVAADPGAFAGAAGNVAIAATSGDVPYAVLFSAESFEFPAAIAFGTAGGPPRALAFGATDADATSADRVDLVALAGGAIWLVQDHADEARQTFSCAFTDGLNLALADLDGDGSAEIVVATPEGVVVVAGSDVVAGVCPTAAQAIGEGGTGFAPSMAVGNFDGGGDDVAIGAPGENAVYVISNGAVASPVAVNGPGGSVSFGEAVAAGDIDGDGTDALIVGDSGRAEQVSRGGAVHILGGGDFETAATLFDADPEEGQRFGRSLAVARWSGEDDILVVGATEEVFTYFRLPIDGDQDVRR